MVSTVRPVLSRCVGAHETRYFLIFGQVNRAEMHQRFDKAGNVTRSEAEETRKAVRAGLRQAMEQVRRLHFCVTMSL